MSVRLAGTKLESPLRGVTSSLRSVRPGRSRSRKYTVHPSQCPSVTLTPKHSRWSLLPLRGVLLRLTTHTLSRRPTTSWGPTYVIGHESLVVVRKTVVDRTRNRRKFLRLRVPVRACLRLS